MSKKKKLREAQIEVFNTKEFFIKYAKRYAITILIAMPFVLIFNYVMAKNVAWYQGAVTFFGSLVLLLFACLIALLIFNKKDDKEKAEMTKEKQRDPFAD